MSNSHFENLRERLRDLRPVLLRNPCSQSYLEFFDEWVREYEFDLALHAVCDYLLEQNTVPENITIEQISSLHEAMDIQDECVNRLRLKTGAAGAT
jgi:hypothetical protein